MTETMSVLLDATLAATLVFIAWRCVSTRDAFGSIALFIVLGLVMAIAWVRLRAPDLALAEAALGSAITGAMLLAVWFEPRRRLPWASPSRRRRLFALLAACGAMGVVAGALLPLLGSQGGLTVEVQAEIAATGVTHPVTAVLLDFRSFDTFLELCVLVAALIGIWRLDVRGSIPGATSLDPVLASYAKPAVAMLIVLGGAILWRGAFAPGGAFQAGATIAAGGVLMMLAAYPTAGPPAAHWCRIGTGLGVLGLLLLGVIALVTSGSFLDWPDAKAGTFILIAEVAATVSISLTLILLVLAARPGPSTGRAGGHA